MGNYRQHKTLIDMALIFRNDPFLFHTRCIFDDLMQQEDNDYVGLPSLIHRHPLSSARTTPPVDVEELEDSFAVSAAVPGLKESDVSVSHLNGVLTLSGEMKSEVKEERDGVSHREIRKGSFSRSIRLPKTADFESEAVRATLHDGILRLVVPKKPEATARQINITAPAQSQL